MYDIEPYRRIEFFLKDLIEAAKNRGGGGGPTPGPTPPEPTPEPPDPNADVLFFDYDGTITNSYTATEFAALTAMPDNPTHQGLTAQGWNWSLADAKDYVSKYGMLDIGQMYITDDGKTRIYIHLTEGRTSPMLGLGVNGSVVVDWGDGSTETLTGGDTGTVVWTEKHNYTSAGDYMITLTVTGSAQISGSVEKTYLLRNSTNNSDAINKVYCESIKAVEIGSSISIGYEAFSMSGATYITIPNSITSFDELSFLSCQSLKAATVPQSFPGILDTEAFKLCDSLERVSLPKGLRETSNGIFIDCASLKRVCLPPSLTELGFDTFTDCTSLKSVVIPQTEANLSLQMDTFHGCTSLTSITIPDSVNKIEGACFYGCSALAFIRFSASTPPTVSSSNAWSNIPTDCIIYVPSGSLTAYTTATNYPDPTTYQYVEY